MQNSVEYYRQVWENSYDAILLTIPDGTILSANPAACKLFNMTEEEICQLGRSGVIDIQDPRVSYLLETRKERGLVKGEVRFVRKGGSTFEGEFNSTVFLDEAGIEKTITIIRDITERKNAEKELQESQVLFSLFMKYSPIYTFIKESTPTESRVIQASDNYIQMIGISGRDMMGKSMEELFPPEHAAKFTADDWTVVSKGDVLKLDEELNGRFYTTIKFPITLGDKTLLAGYTIDITDRKLAELQLEKYAEELKELNKTKDRFFSIIAHDLKSPFQGLLGMTQLFAEDIESFSTAELSKMSKALYNRTKSLFRLLKNLLDWAQTQNGKMSFNPVTLNLSEVISQSMGFIMKRCELKEITITKSIPKTQRVYADEAMLNSILANLLSNAFKFTNRGGKIIIRTKPTENDMVEISIKDNGIGMPTALINKLFKIEEKVGRLGTEGEESTGLGLLLCKEFVEKHGGRFWLDAEENKGSTFYFTIPTGS